MAALAGFAISGRMWAADTVGGDCFGFFPLEGDSLGILIADASGHGFASALLIAQVHAYIRALTVTHRDVGKILSLANCCLGQEISAEYFVTALLMRRDPRTRMLDYAGAGHWPGFVLAPGGGVRAKLNSTRLPLGIDVSLNCRGSDTIRLMQGEVVVILTDGILEASSTAGELFGLDRAIQVVRTHRYGTPEEILDSLARAVQNFSEGRAATDDMTAVVIKCEQATSS